MLRTKKLTLEDVTPALTNRVRQTGVNFAVAIDDVQNRKVTRDQKELATLEVDYVLACNELENTLTTSLLNNDIKPWKYFTGSYNQFKDEEKVLYGGVIKNLKRTTSDILSNKDLKDFMPQVLPYIPEGFITTNPIDVPEDKKEGFWREFYMELEKMDVTARDAIQDASAAVASLAGAAMVATATVAGATATVATAPVTSTVAVAAGTLYGAYTLGKLAYEYATGS